MKKVIFKYVCEFPDETSDSDAINSTVEIMKQADYSDENFEIIVDK